MGAVFHDVGGGFHVPFLRGKRRFSGMVTLLALFRLPCDSARQRALVNGAGIVDRADHGSLGFGSTI